MSDRETVIWPPGPLTERQIADLLGVSRTRVWQILRSGLAKLERHPEIRRIAADHGLTVGEVLGRKAPRRKAALT